MEKTKLMENIIGKPLDPSASGGAVGSSPLKPTNPPIRERILGPFSRYPAVKNALVNKPISRPTLISVSSIEAELAEVRSAWARYRSTNGRDAIYIYLSAVFRVVTRWRRVNWVVKNSKAVLRLSPNPPQMKPEPFGIVIFCTSDPKIVDAKTRSKWSRVLRYAARTKPGDQRLVDFIKSNGGLNECARKFARNK